MNPKLKAIAAKQGQVFSRAQALASGYSAEQVRRRLIDGRWRRIRYGQYAEPVDRSHLPPWVVRGEEHQEAVFAVMNSLRPGSVVVSHHSALLFHQLPVYGLDFSEVQVTRTDQKRTRSIPGVRCHAGRLGAGDLVTIEGLTMSSVARSVFETASIASFESAVVTIDSAIRQNLLSEAETARLLTATEFWPGSPTIRAAISFADGLSESVGESRLRVLMDAYGLPRPQLQAVFEDEQGFVARVDFYFPEFRTVVEFDGLIKYGENTAEVVMREKAREDRLRDLGIEVVRVTWGELADPQALVERIHRAFARRAATI